MVFIEIRRLTDYRLQFFRVRHALSFIQMRFAEEQLDGEPRYSMANLAT